MPGICQRFLQYAINFSVRGFFQITKSYMIIL